MSRAPTSPALAVLFCALLLMSSPSAAASAGALSPVAVRDADEPAAWAWPVADARHILRPYVAPKTRYAAGHRGIDIRATGSVYAPADGVVHFVGQVVDRPVVSLAHDRGLLSSYEPVTSALPPGAVVRRGQEIGTVGEYTGRGDAATAGHCAPGCLHLGVRRNGEYLSPLALFGEIPAAILLPPRRGPS
jgi:murein DD-endopeptidase MepM/ murein hydrolase activator NlpD